MIDQEIELFVKEVILNLDVEVESADHGVGIHSYVGELLSVGDPVERKFIQFYTLSNIPLAPAAPDLGYQPSDMLYEQGVIMADVAGVTHPPQYVGITVTIDEFVNKWIDDDGTRTELHKLMDETKRLSTPGDEWLDQITELYHNRVTGMPWIKNTKRVC